MQILLTGQDCYCEFLKMARFCDLPEALVVEILLLLPADSLLTMKCVCKWWCAMIKDSTFVARHLQYAKKRPSTSILLKYLYQDPEAHMNRYVKRLLSISNEDAHSCKVDENINIPRFCKRNEHWTGPLGSQCNGLLCISDKDEGTILLCNPVTKQSKVLSTSCIVDQYDFRVTDLLGFGYDSRANEYKIIRVVSFEVDEFTFLRHGPSRAEVYSLSTDSWREINYTEPETGRCACADSEDEAYCSGVYYWMVRDIDKVRIVSFDMCAEEFRMVPIPNDMQRLDLRKNLAVWNECVAMMLYPMWSPRIDEPGIPFIEMWVMNKDGSSSSSSSWTKRQTIRLSGDIKGPLTFWKSDELLVDDKNFRVVTYNLHTQRIVNLPLENVMWCRATFFVKSLVPIHGDIAG